MVNEAIFGLLHTSSDFSIGISAAQFASQGGFSLVLPATGNGVFIGLTSATAGLTGGNGYPNGSGAVAATEGELSWNLSDKLSWQRGRHELQFGGEFFVARYRFTYQPLVPVVTFGFDATSDPARSLFTTASFPGASTANLLDAQYLYALLTGRVSQIYNQLAAQSGTGDYVVNGPTDRRSHLSEAGAFVQDAIRLTPNLTLNAGLRYEVQFPFQPDNSLYSIATVADACGVSGQGPGIGGRPCNFFQPGTLTGVTPTYKQYIAGTNGYQIDFDNVAPSVGIAWLPGVKQGWLRTLLGDPEQATVRAAYAVAYNREGLADLAAPFAANASTTIDHVRSAGNGNLVPAAELPLLVSETSRMGPGAGPAAPQFPLPVVRTSGVNLFEANWRVGAVHSYSAGVQRPISRDTAIEIRYVGTRGVNLLENEDWNEPNLIESGFLDEFRRAQANLYANIAAGRGATFAYSGGSDTSPLPIFLGYFNGSAAAADPSRYTGGNWTSTTFLGFLQRLNPNPLGFLSTGMNGLYGNAGRRANAAAAGLAPNLFVLNPDVNAVTVRTSRGGTRYDGLQIELRRRMARGLSMNINYTLSRTLVARLDTIRSERAYVPALSAVPRSFKLAAMYEVPFGRGRRFGAETSGWVDALAGGWMVSATGKVTSGRVLDFGNVRLIGMTIDELRREFRYRIAPAPPGVRPAATVYVLPQDIIDNTIRAFTIGVNGYTGTPPTGRYFAPANGPDCIQVVRGDCAPKALTVTAPMFSRFDLGLRKQVGLGARRLLSIEIDVLNLFNAINFNPVALPGNPANADGYRVTTSYADVGNTYDPGSRVGQVVLRFNW
jgi:hypothetical protein